MLSIDRLSALPDDVICHILSFLSTKISVQTSILARRWRFLWAHVSNLDLDSKNHPSGTSFSHTINKVKLLRKGQSIHTICIRYGDFDCGEYELEAWITSAFQCNVQNIYLDLDYHDISYRLPQCLFTCNTLVGLSLYCCSVGISSIADVSFPSLKNLLLCSIEYEADETLPHLLSGCPMLEELVVESILDRDLGCCYISSPTITRLSISIPFDNSGHYITYGRVKINAPGLRYLDVYDCSYDQISFLPMPSLIEADIHFDIYSLEVDYYIYTRCVLKFINSLCKVKCLKLLGASEEFLDLAVAAPYLRFDNLIKLELTADWRFILKFLESADSLQVLIIHKVAKKLQNWMEPIEKRRACLLSSLRMVKIDQFGCTEQELNMVRYLLMNAQVLEMMEIYCQHDGISLEAKSNGLQRIALFHRGSTECVVAFS
ncbi:F-box/FBD/LRR-repeat protein at5g56420 [Phtheirospermum japonicum]|uniref:F-box/FBD/LRR-repeat protein at5g56420 n=1 Tax=Phtheirospermum japonicum TaxID=374723 RepID=A0A830D5G1_9LAMI|nr:F-box/FBD/LRR-repeat protein at5g56420 [Phtheirospermum japonicum]